MASTGETMLCATDVSLLDVLPGRASGQCGQRQWLRVAPDAQVAQSLGATLQRLDAAQRALRLCSALALVESHLTGVTQVAVSLQSDALHRGTVEVPREGDAVAWQHQVEQALRDTSERSGASTWCVMLDGAMPAPDDAVSVWSFGSDDEPALHIGVCDPMAADAAALLARCAWRVLAALGSGVPLERIDLLDADERKQLLIDWNDTAQARSPHDTVHRRFAQAVARNPDAEAVVDDRKRLSYAQLDRASDALAARLRRHGVVAGDAVAVAMERSVDAVVAVLGVIKAGAAYLPLDLSHPEDRLAFMLDDAQARAVVVADAGAPLPLPAQLTRIAAVADDGNESADAFAVDGDALAYVMYTSGSTGTPKGVQIRHRSILRLVIDVDYVELGPQTRMLHAAPLGFDASTLELWGALLNGGCVVVHGEALPTGAGLASCIQRHGVTTAWLTAALFNTVVDEDPSQLAGLHELFTGGEALSVDHVRRMRAAAPTTKLRNGYGPTECTTFTCTHAIDGDIDDDCQSIPIGRPIADTQLYILNARREPVPTGVIGELYVGGEGVARGYLKRPELSAERFVEHPFIDGERVYRTGDLVRYRADGVVEFIGRVDTQVKIRGFRIELGEIETVLARYPQVQACAVLARADSPGEKRLVAYYVAESAISAAALRAHLASSLPEFMVPARYLRLPSMPLTANGKLDRRALPAPDRSRPELACAFEPSLDDNERVVCEAFADVLDLERVGRHDNFFELGGSSLLGLRLLERLRTQRGGERIASTLLFRHPTPATLAAALAGAAASALDPARMAHGGDGDAAQEPIAIIAMAGRFPGAQDVESFWRNLCDGRDTITVFAPEELDASIGAAERSDPSYVPARGVIEGVEQFDAAFFGISPKEAELMDPQQRIFLELCWECLERGGHAPDATGMPVGVFAGMYNATYFQRHVSAHPDLVDKLGAFQVMLGNEKDYIATRTAHRLNLTGPAISVHTACSTSLVAICQAMDSLRAGRCDMALAGGASVTCPPRSGYRYQEGSMLSPDGHTRTFDARAQGTVFSDGAAVVLLKRLSDAVRDGNPVYALIRGGAVNNDGGHKASFTAPSSEGQAAVIAMAHDHAGVDPRSIGYVETHGTATPLGDPIEIEGLTRAFRRGTDEVGFCRIGSVKTNIGHTVIAAGATGVIKTALTLAEQRIPANVHFESAHPALALDGSPFVVNAALSDWPRGDVPRRAGVSSFGVGGTNAHVVMEEAPPAIASEAAPGPHLLTLSARTPAALERAASRLAQHLDDNRQLALPDVAWTLAVGRKAFAHRVAVAADDLDDAVRRLRAPETVAAATRSRPARGSDVVFLFPGQGATYVGMGRALYAAQPAFRDAIDECAAALSDDFGFDLRERMFSDADDALLPTAVMQPATFAIEYALARWWMSQGLTPAAMIGHSVGEFVAATLAGVFHPRDAVRLVAQRGALMQAQPAGGMLSIRAAADDVLARLPATLSLAAENAPGACVVAGPLDAIAAFQAQLEGEGVACRALRTSHAFHSVMMEPVLAPFREAVASVARNAPKIPMVSTALADWLDADTAVSADYWTRHLREPVRFAGAVAKVLEDRSRVLLEVGPRATLCGLVRQHPQWQKQHVACVASLADTPEREASDVLAAAGALWAHGVALDPATFDRRQRRQRVLLPTYPFERQRYWVEAAAAATGNVVAMAVPAPVSVVAPVASASPVSNPVPPEIVMPSQLAPSATPAADTAGRRTRLIAQLKDVFEDVAGFDMADAESDANFIELGLDSLMLTQVALQLEKAFGVKVTFRQLMGECASLDALSTTLDAQMPADAPPPVSAPLLEAVSATPSMPAPPVSVPPTTAVPTVTYAAPAMLAMPQATPAVAADDFTRYLIAQQMQLMSQQLALLGGGAPMAVAAAQPMALPAPIIEQAPAPVVAAPAASAPIVEVVDEEAALAHTKYDVKKAFGAIARIDNKAQIELTTRQREKLDAFMARYIARTRASKDYTQAHRPHMADPRVVNGFRPLLKEIVYQIVIQRSKGAHMVDLDGHDYVDALNGFGMSLFGWQPDFVLDAVREQLDLGYEIGPQHPLAGEVAQLVCEVTGHDRAALCNTGSEAVLGALRIARTVTGRETVVLFTGSYHGIVDEMIVRGTKKLRAVPAAPGILRNTAEHVLVLDYGTPESMQIIRERAGEIAAVLVEPVQSRRPDFQPREFLDELRQVTRDAGALLVFDEVVTGFRAHPAGAQGHFGIRADLATYGKVVGGGYPIGVIAGKREYMDALDGGHWQFGDDSVPTVGVTYFAGTFVRHPLALAAAKAVLTHVKQHGKELQDNLNARATAMVAELNDFCAVRGAPIEVRHFASVWKTFFLEDHPLQDLLFAMMRSRGVHILDNFPCFLTTAHSDADLRRIIDAFKESVIELQEAEFLPRHAATPSTAMDARDPVVAGARLGRDPDGRPGWYIPDPQQPGQFLKVG